MTAFFQRLALVQASNSSLLCVGLDPDPARLPASIRTAPAPIFEFNKAIIDATADLVCAFKPQIAHYAAIGAEAELERTIDYIRNRNVPVILDAKRGDIGSTAERYAVELFERYGADAATINPYLGFDSIKPYLAYEDRGCFLLCRTSNPGGADLQNLELANGEQVFEHVARKAANDWNAGGNLGLVVGATRPAEVARIREIAGSMTLLIPGIGAQGGDVRATVTAGEGGGMVLNSSRGIIYAGEDGEGDFAAAVRGAATAARDEINEFHRAA